MCILYPKLSKETCNAQVLKRVKIRRIFIHPFVCCFSGSHISNVSGSTVVLGIVLQLAGLKGWLWKVGHRRLNASPCTLYLALPGARFVLLAF